jgi:hypothetical protein
MSVRTKARLLAFVVAPLGFFSLGLLGMLVHPVFVFFAFAHMLVVNSYCMRIRCPECATPVGWHTFRFLGLGFEWWNPHVPKTCEWCGHDLTEKQPKEKA